MADADDIVLPYNWQPRGPQLPLWQYLEGGGLRAIQIAHRRWGKDDVGLHFTAAAAHERIGGYWHCLPEYEQAKRAIWNAVNPHTGKRRIDEAFPVELRESSNSDEMFIRLKCGSTWQVIGSDRFRGLVGAGVCGIVFSEWAKANPAAWAYLAPILVENRGWSLFITTPQGANHAKRMYEMALKDSAWFANRQSIVDSGMISLEVVEAQRAEYRALYGEEAGDSLIDQEFYCDFDAPVLGSYWGKAITDAERKGRVREVPHDPERRVHCVWGLVDNDMIGVWCYQMYRDHMNVIDYVENANSGLDYFARWLAERGYHGVDWVPSDARMKEASSYDTRSRVETLRRLGRRPAVLPESKLSDRVNAARETIPHIYFDAVRCMQGLEALKAYRAEWDEKNNVFMSSPVRNWAMCAANAWGFLGTSWEFPRLPAIDKERAERERLRMVGIVPGGQVHRITVNDLIKLHKRSSRGGRRY